MGLDVWQTLPAAVRPEKKLASIGRNSLQHSIVANSAALPLISRARSALHVCNNSGIMNSGSSATSVGSAVEIITSRRSIRSRGARRLCGSCTAGPAAALTSCSSRLFRVFIKPCDKRTGTREHQQAAMEVTLPEGTSV